MQELFAITWRKTTYRTQCGHYKYWTWVRLLTPVWPSYNKNKTNLIALYIFIYIYILYRGFPTITNLLLRDSHIHCTLDLLFRIRHKGNTVHNAMGHWNIMATCISELLCLLHYTSLHFKDYLHVSHHLLLTSINLLKLQFQLYIFEGSFIGSKSSSDHYRKTFKA